MCVRVQFQIYYHTNTIPHWIPSSMAQYLHVIYIVYVYISRNIRHKHTLHFKVAVESYRKEHIIFIVTMFLSVIWANSFLVFQIIPVAWKFSIWSFKLIVYHLHNNQLNGLCFCFNANDMNCCVRSKIAASLNLKYWW